MADANEDWDDFHVPPGFEDLISGIPAEHIVRAGHNDDNLDYVILCHVEFVVKGPWHEWTVKFEDGKFHHFSKEWTIENFAWNTHDKEVLLGFWHEDEY
jgi:hypothetical protein